MNKTIFLILSFVIAWSSNYYSQEVKTKSKFDISKYQDLVWFNCDRPDQYLAQKNALFLFVYWNNFDVNAERTAIRIKEIKKNNPSLKVVLFYNILKKEEKEYAHFRTHLLRNNIEVPTVIVSDNKMIEQMNIDQYPTAILYSPRYGEIKTYKSLNNFQFIDADFKKELLDPRNTDLTPFSENFHKLIEDYPESLFSRFSYITAVKDKDWIFLSQPQKNRIILADVQGNILQVFGSGTSGYTEGNISFIQFNHPEGMYWDEETQSLYVADTYNNCIRKIDFNSNTSSTVISTQKEEIISYPTDMCFHDGLLYITMQGLNQIWTLNLSSMESSVLTDNSDKIVEIKKPSSLAIDENRTIYVVEKNTGKLIKLNKNYKKSNIKFEHPVSHVLWNDNHLLVTSEYGDKIYILEDDKIVSTIGGKAGYSDGKFDNVKMLEPSDIIFMNGSYYFIDEGNELVRALNLKNKRINTVEYENMGVLPERIRPSKKVLELEPILLAPGYNQIHIKIEENNDYLIDSKYGNNEILPGDFPAIFTIDDANINDKNGLLSTEGENAKGIIEIIVSLTYFKNDFPKKYYHKMQRYYIPVTLDPNVTGTHEVIIPLID